MKKFRTLIGALLFFVFISGCSNESAVPGNKQVTSDRVSFVASALNHLPEDFTKDLQTEDFSLGNIYNIHQMIQYTGDLTGFFAKTDGLDESSYETLKTELQKYYTPAYTKTILESQFRKENKLFKNIETEPFGAYLYPINDALVYKVKKGPESFTISASGNNLEIIEGKIVPIAVKITVTFKKVDGNFLIDELDWIS
ncbi:MAG: hypothetical protein ACRCWQ_09085 [Bacilli bacterium]